MALAPNMNWQYRYAPLLLERCHGVTSRGGNAIVTPVQCLPQNCRRKAWIIPKNVQVFELRKLGI